jgi:hypothetical protein
MPAPSDRLEWRDTESDFVAGMGEERRRSKGDRQQMATISQLVRKPRKRKVVKKYCSCTAGLPAAPGSVYAGVYDDPEEA